MEAQVYGTLEYLVGKGLDWIFVGIVQAVTNKNGLFYC